MTMIRILHSVMMSNSVTPNTSEIRKQMEEIDVNASPRSVDKEISRNVKYVYHVTHGH